MESFDFKPEIEKERNAYLSQFQRRVKIGIHVRRGDYAKEWENPKSIMHEIHRMPTASFYENAMNSMIRQFGEDNIVFIIASDDPEWCMSQDVFRDHPGIAFSRKSAELDFAILAGCDHAILGFGTYGWWASFLVSVNHRNRETRPLGGGQVVYYGDFFVPSSKVVIDRVRCDDIYPPEWTPLYDGEKTITS